MRRKLNIGIIDLVTKKPDNKLFARIMNANFASIMPRVIGVWCEEEGHNVTYVCYTGKEDLISELPQFYFEMIKRDLGSLWEYLPEGAINHDRNAYMNAKRERIAV